MPARFVRSGTATPHPTHDLPSGPAARTHAPDSASTAWRTGHKGKANPAEIPHSLPLTGTDQGNDGEVPDDRPQSDWA
jgi:hypothetical protein